MAFAQAGVLALAAVLGIVVGAVLDGVIERVPGGIRPGRRTGRPIRRIAVELVTAAAFAGVAGLALIGRAPGGVDGWVATTAVTVAFLWFAAISVALTVIDIRVHRLPDALVLPSYAVVGILFPLACLGGAAPTALARAAAGAAALFLLYFGLRLIQPTGMGGGDVKLAGVIGAYLGWTGWQALLIGAVAAFVLGGLFGAMLLVARRAGRRTRIPFGPWMLVGAWTGVLMGADVVGWYAGLSGR